jgi:hypothetical protein
VLRELEFSSHLISFFFSLSLLIKIFDLLPRENFLLLRVLC